MKHVINQNQGYPYSVTQKRNPFLSLPYPSLLHADDDNDDAYFGGGGGSGDEGSTGR